jgi:hypothetical protein
MNNNLFAITAAKKAIKTTCEAFKINELQARMLVAVYCANERSQYPDMGDLVEMLGEAQRQGCYTPMRKLCSKRLIYGTENKAKTSKRGKNPVNYTISPKGIEIVNEFDIILTAYST